MEVFDLHCDAVCKLLANPGLKFDRPDSRLDVDATGLQSGGVAVQVFALFLPETMPMNPVSLLQAAECYHESIVAHPGMMAITEAEDFERVRKSGKIGAILSLEGVDGLQGQFWALRLLHRLGLRLLGPTWNHANWACDGAMEPRGGGLTKRGLELVAECESMGILLDVSHMSERGFWDLADAATRPFFASHSNVRKLMPHARNLTDEQIRALIAVDGLIGITFVPWFLTDRESATIDDVLRHVEYVCALGGQSHISFGSDFDGITRHVTGLSRPGHYPHLVEALLRQYPESLVRNFLGGNAKRFFQKNLIS
jgi:membrane dipeptidase